MTALSEDSSVAEDLSWSRAQLETSLGVPCSIIAVDTVASRTTRLHRLVITSAMIGKRTLYLKRFPPAVSVHEFEQHFEQIRQIASAFEHLPRLVPYEVIASAPARRLLLVAEMPGTSLAAARRHALGRAQVHLRSEVKTWHAVGMWLGHLHRGTLSTASSVDRPHELASYTKIRFAQWVHCDSTQRRLVHRAEQALDALVEALHGRSVEVTPCHGDVCAENIIVGERVGLIDLDDFRFDMPASDLSQALLEIEEFSRIGSLLPIAGFKKRARAAFLSGYGAALLGGPEFWLPHFRNLSVFVLTLATRRVGLDVSRLTTEFRYRRTVAELRRSIASVLASGGHARYIRSA